MAKQRRIDSLTKEFEFTRLQYQSASTAAASSATAIAELQSQIPLLESRASENMKIMREQRDRDENAALRKEVNRLREEVKSRERLVVKKEERIRELERGRGVRSVVPLLSLTPPVFNGGELSFSAFSSALKPLIAS